MASAVASSQGTRPASGEFPLKLAEAVLEDILKKGIEASLSPSDDGKTLAYEAAQAALPRRLALITSQVAAADPDDAVEGIFNLVQLQWGALHRRPDVSLIQPSMLESSAWLAAFTSVFEAVRAAATDTTNRALCTGGILVCRAAINFAAEKDERADRVSGMLALLEWWGDEVCSKRWGVTDAWGFCEVAPVRLTPLHFMAANGSAALLPLAIRKGCPVNGDWAGRSEESPVYKAFRFGHMDVVEALIDLGADLMRPYEKDGWPSSLRMFATRGGNKSFLAGLLAKHPGIITATTSSSPLDRSELCGISNLLGAAVASEDAGIIEIALDAGVPVEYRCVCEQEKVVVRPTLSLAIPLRNPKVLRLLMSKGRIFDDWQAKYDHESLSDLSWVVAEAAISAYPPNPECTKPCSLAAQDPKLSMECLEMVLASGIVCPWDIRGRNSLMRALYPRDSSGKAYACRLAEKDALDLLKTFHRAGFNVLQYRAEHCAIDAPDLQLSAAVAGHAEVLGWCLGALGARTEPLHWTTGPGHKSPLCAALNTRNVACALMLLKKYKAVAAYPDRPLEQQPVVCFSCVLPHYTDAEAEKLLAALIERDRSLFAVECFSAESVAAYEAKCLQLSPSDAGDILDNIVYRLMHPPKPRTLELLLKSKLPGVTAMINRRVVLCGDDSDECLQRSTAAEVGAFAGSWECLSILLRYTDARVTPAVDGFPSAAEHVKRAASGPDPAPRTLVAMVEARARKEVAEADAGSKPEAGAASATPAPGEAGGVGVATNAFEDPSLQARCGGKKKNKKKGSKKKGKGKKRAAANAGAGGAGRPRGDDTESDDSSTDDGEEEPDDNLVDSRNAPSLDLMLVQMRLKKK